MAGKQAKILSETQIAVVWRHLAQSPYPDRDRAMLLLSVKAGLRAAEIAGLTWEMVEDAAGRVTDRIELADRAAKKRSGRTVPLHADLRRLLTTLHRTAHGADHVIQSGRGGAMRASSVVNWFYALYAELGLHGCSSHSGRRTFITRAARLVAKTGGSLRDVQQLAGHRSIEQTQAYIDGNTAAKRRLIALL